MENIFRIAFLMLFLSGGQGRPANFKALQNVIGYLQKKITCPEGSVFYAPSPADVKKSTAAALVCSIQQLKYLNNTPNLQHHINMTMKTLQGMFVDEIRTDSSECTRENPLSFKDFMENINTLAESLAVKLNK